MELWSWTAMLIGIPAAVVVSAVVGAVVVQAAAAFAGVEDIRFFKALALVLLLAVGNGAVVALAAYLSGLFAAEPGQPLPNVPILAVGILAPACMLVTGGIFRIVLHISYLRGLLVALMTCFVSLVLGALVGGLVLVVLGILQVVAHGS